MTAPTAGMILAAGLGTRFGGRKLLAPIDSQPMLQRVLNLAADARLAPVVVVLGNDADELRSACQWRDEWLVFNRDPAQGIASSVRVGLSAVSAGGTERVAVLLGDQPFLTRQQLAAVVNARGQIVIPRYAGKPGNPVVLGRSVWPLASRLEGDRGFSQIFSEYSNLVTYVDVPGKNPDIDSLDDLAESRRHA
jgi:molybdenum cofactor cytidylyltransferase